MLSWVSTISGRQRFAVLVAFATVVCLTLFASYSVNLGFLMPGPLTSGHSTIANCSSCHSAAGIGKLSWLHRLTSVDQPADSLACLSCHQMPSSAFNAHSAPLEVLRRSTEKLKEKKSNVHARFSEQALNIVFPVGSASPNGVFCATCHQEHQGVNFNLKKISNERCHTCHVRKFDRFDGQHPQFDSYPFSRRTRIIYDHTAHFSKHFAAFSKNNPTKVVPTTCAACHNSNGERRLMAVAPFDQTCATCHLDQITGKERAGSPKGVAFLTLPGLDLETLSKRIDNIGDWPEASDAVITPLMKVLISRNEQGRAVLKSIDGINLQDLSGATDDQLTAVANLVWEIKGLFSTLTQGKISDVMADVQVGNGLKPGAARLADLTAGLPLDVVLAAQKEWLPNLSSEISGRGNPGQQSKVHPPTALKSPDAEAPPAELPAEEQPKPEVTSIENTPCTDEPVDTTIEEADEASAEVDQKPDAIEELDSVDEEAIAAVKGRLPLPNGTPRAIKGLAEGAKKKKLREAAETRVRKANTEKVVTPKEGCAEIPQPVAAQAQRPDSGEVSQFDDLLFPDKNLAEAPPSQNDQKQKQLVPLPTNAKSLSGIVPEPEPASVVDPESWAVYGGWYRQDYTIYYSPVGHKDKFLHAWLTLVDSSSSKGAPDLASQVFAYLAKKDAPGLCTKCHSVDEIQGRGLAVNFSPASIADKQGRFTKFLHEPHFAIMDGKGCVSCHQLKGGDTYLKSYEGRNAQKFSSNFAAVSKEKCQTCHTRGLARQDCLLCHDYHINSAITIITNTKVTTPK